MFEVRDATIDDLDKIMDIYVSAKSYMNQNGNPTQWREGYPSKELIIDDINNKRAKVIYEKTEIYGVFALFDGIEPTYININGAFLNEEPYLTIHRIASNQTRHGVFKAALDYVSSISKNIRIDTHKNNLTMQKLFEKYGFVYCGIIHLKDGTERLAYQKIN